MSLEYDSDDDVRKSFEAAYEAIRERMRNGGPGWVPKVRYEEDDSKREEGSL